MPVLVRTGTAAVLLACSLAVAASGQEAAKIDSKAEAIVRKMTDFVKNLETFRARLAMDMTVEVQGMKQEVATVHRLAMERPNKLAMVLEQGMMGSTVVSDGEKIYTFVPMMGDKYVVADAPDSLEQIGAEAGGAIGTATMFGRFLFAEDPYAALMEGVTALEYLGQEEVNGVPCHQLRFVREASADVRLESILLLESGDRPVVRKLSIDMSEMFATMGARMYGGGDMKSVMVLSFDDWEINPKLAADEFAFVPPEGAVEARPLFGSGGDVGARDEPLLVGAEAPLFTLPLLDGGEVDLAVHNGKNIVILDFWATWCKPCVLALPILVEVAEAYEDRGVVFYAVNLREKPQVIQTFLERKAMDFRVALDKDAGVGKLYGVQGIPQTVIIGKDGTVQAVHVGLLPDLKKKLSGELDALLAGENLAKKN